MNGASPSNANLPGIPENSAGRRAAKLAFWSPFAGLSLLITLGVAIGNRENAGLQGMLVVYGLSALVFAAGFALGVTTLRRTKVEGRKGIFGRALMGLVLNGLLLLLMLILAGVDLYVLAWEAKVAKIEHQEASDNQKFETAMKAANADFGSSLSKLQTRYEASWSALTKPPSWMLRM